jgi:hypothetical protein
MEDFIGTFGTVNFIKGQKRMKKGFLKWRAVVVGMVVDLGGGVLLSICASLYFIVRLLSSLEGPPLSGFEIQELMSEEIEEGLSGSIILVLLGGGLSIIGGNVSGRIARIDEVKHGLATGIGSLLVSVTTAVLFGGGQAIRGRELSNWLLPIAIAAMNIAAATFGGYIAYLRRYRISEIEAN